MHALNNWALCRYLSGAHAEALRILAPVLGSANPAPFSRALASLAQSALGQREAAQNLLYLAISDLDKGLAQILHRNGTTEAAWLEYTTLVKRAAGEVGNHRLVLDLHNRWPGRDLPLGAFPAGVAAFNLGRYAQAAKYWRRIADPGWVPLMRAYARVAGLVEQGVVPPFPLEYDTGAHWENPPTNPEAMKAMGTSGAVRMRFLGLMFDEDAQDVSVTTANLIYATGSWGIDLGHRLLAGSAVPLPIKLGAAQALVQADVFELDQPIPIVHQGKRTAIVIKKAEVQDSSPEWDKVVAEAMRLRDAGRKDEALRLLSDLQMRGIAYPPAMLTQANLLREKGELEAARGLLESLERIAPDHPAVLFNLASLWLQVGNLRLATRYANRIDPTDTVPEFRQMLAGLRTV